jgi:hypothetical protein
VIDMENINQNLSVTSHVGRDLLQSSAVFEHERLVVWEYVSNGLDYLEIGTKPVVRVHIDNKKKSIRIIDNGRGMSFDDLKNFFTMHGENIDRQQKRRVRGFFGTGKSAAFGIAGTLRVTTVSNGLRATVELHKKEVEASTSGDPVPVKIVEQNVATKNGNGTVIDIENIYIKHIDQSSIIDYIEQHLARWSKDVTVFVNNHECEFKEPPVREVHIFKPEGAFLNAIGNVELTIKVSKTPLDDDAQGIAIFSNGVWYETTMAGTENKDQANLIFGEIDVPELDNQGNAEISAFDLSRKMKLNKKNPIVQKIHGFIGIHIEEVRKKLAAEERERRKGEDARKLEQEANKIADIINSDFSTLSQQLKSAHAKISGTTDFAETISKGEDENPYLTPGDDITAVIDKLTGGDNPGEIETVETDGPGPIDDPENESNTSGLLSSDNNGDTKAAHDKGKKRHSAQSGGFSVQFHEAGGDAPRASYESAARTIWINLDHPQLSAALSSGGIEDVAFRRLAYEVAFSEYAIGLVHEFNAINFYYDVEDAIFAVRETINRISRAASSLYSPNN